MTLAPSNVTAASRRMLPTYPVFVGVVGLSFTLTPRERLIDGPGLRFADHLAPLPYWGAGFLVVALVLVGALLVGRRALYQGGLSLMVLWMGLWSAVLVWAALKGNASFSAWAWPAFAARASWATLVSLESREV